MTTNYPGSLDDTTILKNDAVNATLTETTHPAHHNNVSDAILAIETELGVNPSGGFATVAAAIATLDTGGGGYVLKTPTADQIVLPTADKINLALRAYNSGQTSKVLEIRNAAGSVVGYFDKVGNLSAASFAVAGTALAASHLSNGVEGSGAVILKTSPTITTPTISNPTVTTGSFSSPALTGTPTAPTPSPGDNTTKIATTAFVVDAIGAGSSVPTGTILPYAGSSAPAGYLMCDGAAVSRVTYATLFGVISTAYGPGDGINTFNLPDTQGRFLAGKGTHLDVDALGDNDGSALASRRPTHKHQSTIDSQGAHTHSVSGTTAASGSHSHNGSTSNNGTHSHGYTAPSGSGSALGGPDQPVVSGEGGASTGSAGDHSHSVNIDTQGSHTHTFSVTSGSNGSHTHTITVGPQTLVPNDSPAYVVVNYIIKT